MFGVLRGRTPVAPELMTEVLGRLRALFRPADGHPEPAEPARSDDGIRSPDGIPDVDEPATPRLRRAHVVTVTVLLLVALVAAVVLVVRQRPVPELLPAGGERPTASMTGPVDPTGPTPGGPKAATTGTTVSPSPTSRIVVHVAGKVESPGVVRLRSGARVIDALEAAGGTKPGADLDGSLNLARLLQDGEQVLVGVTAPPRPPAVQVPGSTTASEPTESAPIDLNTATLDQLETLPGIGPVLAQRILDHRIERGGFNSVQELYEVSGIGDSRFAELKDRVTVG